jgi:predicted dienelactone hydrolase
MSWWLVAAAWATSVQVTGTCPGTVTYRVEASPRATVALVVGDEAGTAAIPAGSCAGLPTALAAPSLAGLRRAPASGVVSFQATTTDCDAWVQAIDLRRCDASPARRRGPAPDYRARGPWEVGSVVFPVVGRSGVALPSELWFPAEQAGTTTRTYVTSGYADGLGTAWTDTLPTCTSPRPVLVHSHGSLSLPFEMFEVMEQLASHGWIVLAPEHSGNSWHDQSGWFLDMPYRRPRDVADAYAALVAESQRPGSPIAGCVDPDAGYVASGNSFGGYTAYATGGALVNDPFAPTLDLSDPDVRAIVTFVPWAVLGLLGSGAGDVTVPVLTFGGERDSTVGTDFQTLFGYLTTTPRVGYSFPDGGHLSFTPLWCDAPGNGCGPSFVDTDIAVEVAWTGTLSFLEHLRGRDGAAAQLPLTGPFSVAEVGWP